MTGFKQLLSEYLKYHDLRSFIFFLWIQLIEFFLRNSVKAENIEVINWSIRFVKTLSEETENNSFKLLPNVSNKASKLLI